MHLQAKFATGTNAKKAAGIVEKLLQKQQFRGHGWTWTDTSLYEHEVCNASACWVLQQRCRYAECQGHVQSFQREAGEHWYLKLQWQWHHSSFWASVQCVGATIMVRQEATLVFSAFFMTPALQNPFCAKGREVNAYTNAHKGMWM